MRRQITRFIIMVKVLVLPTSCGFQNYKAGTYYGNANPAYQSSTYTVRRGDTVYQISKKYNVRIRDIISVNQLAPPYRLQIGDKLQIRGSVVPAKYTVRRGDTLYSISQKANVSVSVLARQNSIESPYRISVGQQLKLPQRYQIATKRRLKTARSTKKTKERRNYKTPELKAPPRTSSRFMWPVQGKVISKFGKKKGGLYNDGLNIAAAAGSPVRAAENGVVAYGGQELAGFGNLILIKHSGGYVTAYAHNSVILVKRGQKVRRGQIIAKVGSTGAVARPQLHFEIRKGRRSVNPLRHLVRRTAAHLFIERFS